MNIAPGQRRALGLLTPQWAHIPGNHEGPLDKLVEKGIAERRGNAGIGFMYRLTRKGATIQKGKRLQARQAEEYASQKALAEGVEFWSARVGKKKGRRK